MTARRPPRWRRVLAALDARGATYAALPDRPGWFIAEWHDPDYPSPNGGPWHQVFMPGRRFYGSKALMRSVAKRAELQNDLRGSGANSCGANS
jgi:hypothetical protein